MQVIGIMTFLFLSLLGVVELIRKIVFFALRLGDFSGFSVVVKPKNAEDCEMVIRSVAEKVKWLELGEECDIICIYDENDKELEELCIKLSLKYPHVTLLKSGDM